MNRRISSFIFAPATVQAILKRRCCARGRSAATRPVKLSSSTTRSSSISSKPCETAQTFSYEQRRRRRLVAELESVRKYLWAAAVKIPLRPQARYQIATLPPDVDLQPGRLRVEDLLSKRFELAQSAAKAFHQLRVLRVSAIERSRPH